MNSLDSVVCRNKDLAWRVIEGSAFIVDSGGSMLHELNDTGSFIWELINAKHTLKEIASLVSEEFDVSQSQAEKDVLNFIKELEAKAIVVKK